MSGDSTRRTRLLAGGCVYLVIIALFLVVAVLLLLSVMVTGFFDRPPEPKRTTTPSRAEVTRHHLEDLAHDGTLTNEEITYAARDGRWHQETDDTTIRITVTYPDEAGSPEGCYRFVLRRPLNLDTRVALPAPGEGCVPRTPASAPIEHT
ncbi:hypothetical protein [Streptomyces sp. NPDC002994]|uniref:hypothetical protein n=1 Tax=Streptomyces sp. NPDC002994 TaxID=3154441 RepID=UPI0033A22B91